MTAPATGFAGRHLGPDDGDQRRMLDALGAADMQSFIAAAVPDAIREEPHLQLPPPLSEADALAALRQIAQKNQCHTSLIGQGYHASLCPPVIQRNLLENPAWYTAYTPYQAEISQGRLELLFHFQTMVCELTGLDVANASLLDEASAAAEAMMLCRRQVRGRTLFYADHQCLPQTLAVLATRAAELDMELRTGAPDDAPLQQCFGLLLQYPGADGGLDDRRALIERATAAGCPTVMAADPMALMLLEPPGALGAHAAIGNTQRFGVPLGFGGPHAAYMAVRKDWQRGLPGRLVGLSRDRLGRPAWRLALQTREQHIRRDRATSNICTAQALLANMAAAYAVWHGPDGLAAIAGRIHSLTAILAAGLRAAGVRVRHGHFFDTLCIDSGADTAAIHRRAGERRINLRHICDHSLGLSLDECSGRDLVEQLWDIFGAQADFAQLQEQQCAIPDSLRRRARPLGQEVFNSHHSETGMMRWLRRLADRDLALDRTMIPLGSCTMKLNAAAEMMPVSWPEFSALHPFAPKSQAAGWHQLTAELERDLAAITGYAAVSLQPNAGSQGEYAGLLAIAHHHRARGQGQRDLCLIPASAHGTNPASAALCGMRIAMVQCDAHGNICLADLRRRLAADGAQLAALMLTYPSTHGVFEPHVREVCELVHEHGGQVYMDGANLNALVGLARPGRFGGDVSHLNLHKTFCIPHGGGGPGVGPVAVAQHLAPYLPGHPLEGGPGADDFGVGPVAAAPWGSAGVLPITWMYLRMMGAPGLRRATEVAILSANYIAHRLGDHYPVLYRGIGGHVAHECLIDLRGFKKSAGVDVEDVAKRLIDYGFHAPTMAFPVPGTLMIEPTESESLAEIDRFCDAMLSIHAEIEAVAQGQWPRDDNPLTNAPHTHDEALADNWPHPYSRAIACTPAPSPAKYWPPVARVDNAHGDRQLVCSTPPPTAP